MIRKYESKDVEVVMEIWRRASTQAHSFLNAEFVVKAEDDLRNIYLPATETWVYEIDGNVVGFISMVDNKIGGLFVLPQFQGKGIGSALVDFVATKFSELEVEVFERNLIGITFYDKYGFVPRKSYMHDESGEVVRKLTYAMNE